MKALAVAGGVLLLVPVLVGSTFYVNLASQILIAAILALSLNVLVGYGGLISLGHAAYLGTCAYLVIHLTTRGGLGHLAAAAVALALTTAMAMLFGILALRATGLGFLMITLALGQILWGLAYRWVGLTGGDNGLGGLVRPRPLGIDLGQPTAFFYFVLLVFALAFTAMARFVRSPFGQSLQGVRDQPRRMSALGHNVWLVQWLSYIYAGFWGGVAGLLYAYYHQYVSPHAFGLMISAEALLMVISGGAGTLLGPVLGATLIVLLKNLASAYVTRWVMLLGVVFVLIVQFMPDGLVPGVARLAEAVRRRRAAGTAARAKPAALGVHAEASSDASSALAAKENST
jgi:branched-chain amino acid transport system permease protein